MSKALANPKLFAAATILFALATFVNFGTASGGEDGRGLVAPIGVPIEKSSPTILPDPWEDPSTVGA